MAMRRRDSLLDVEMDCGAYFVERDRQLVFHGFYRDIQYFGHFPVFQAIFLCQLEDDLTFRRQLIDGSLDHSKHVRGDHQLLGVKIDAGEVFREFCRRMADGAPLFFEVVVGAITGADIQVDLEIADPVEIAAALPYLDKNVGDHFFCRFLCFKEGPGKMKQVTI